MEMLLNVEVCDVVFSVGSFIEFVSCKLDDDELIFMVIEIIVVCKNVFIILIFVVNYVKYLLDKRKEINNKICMYNDIIEWLCKMNVGFILVNIDIFGIGFVNFMIDGLWYIERNYDILVDMVSFVFVLFKYFKIYYCLEKWKRKKVDFFVLNEDIFWNYLIIIMMLFFFLKRIVDSC